MTKIIVLIKRKPGISREDFRAHYETHHADLALTVCRPFLLDYRRSYPTDSFSYFDTVETAATIAAPAFEYDCITEMWFENKSRMDAMFAALAEPEVRRMISEDEERFIDARSVVVLPVEETHSAV